MALEIARGLWYYGNIIRKDQPMTIPSLTPPEIGSRWQHAKSQGYYTIINHGTMQSPHANDMAHVTIYEAESNHSVWVRETSEFFDGRFIRVTLP